MKQWAAALVVLVGVSCIGAQVASACGDKFLMVGRGVRFSRAYAAIHPASILIVVPPKSVKNAAVRDSNLQTALKLAGHRVAVTPSAGVADAIARSRFDIILAERADAVGVPEAAPGQPKATVVGVLEDPSAAEMAAAGRQLDAVLKTPQPLADILKLVDDVMKTRLEKARP